MYFFNLFCSRVRIAIILLRGYYQSVTVLLLTVHPDRRTQAPGLWVGVYHP